MPAQTINDYAAEHGLDAGGLAGTLNTADSGPGGTGRAGPGRPLLRPAGGPERRT